jgi:hypothetical protein
MRNKIGCVIGLFLIITGMSFAEKAPGRAVGVEKIIYAPNKYKGSINVSGKVVKVFKDKKVFLLGCEDACLYMPVGYKGKMPETGRQISVWGEIHKQENGKFIFNGTRISRI